MNKNYLKENDYFYSIWALFEKEHDDELQSIKKIIESQTSGPSFKLHLTLSCCLYGNLDKLLIGTEKVSKKCKSFLIKIQGYGFKEKIFESIFLKIEKSKNLIFQKRQIDTYFEINNKNYFPHVSLYYGNIKRNEKIRIIKKLPIINKEVKIKKIALVLNDEINLSWKVIETFDLYN